jgi:hypothetical protein
MIQYDLIISLIIFGNLKQLTISTVHDIICQTVIYSRYNENIL